MKARMRADLTDAMKARRADEVTLLRSLLAEIDNAEAPAIDGKAGSGASEVDRLALTAAAVQAVLMSQIEERERAAAEMTRLSHRDRAEVLLGQANMARRYLTSSL